MSKTMLRRAFIGLGGGAVAAALCPRAAHAQPTERVRRLGVLSTAADNDPGFAVFVKELSNLGWSRHNLHVERRFAIGSDAVRRKFAAGMVALAPDVILSGGSGATGALLQATRTIPIVFVQVADPVEAGFVTSLARPGGNATGFTNFEVSVSAKWLELLKQIAPAVSWAAVIRDPGVTNGVAQFDAIRATAPALGLDLRPVDVRNAGIIERDLNDLARNSGGGVIVTGSAFALVHRDLIVDLATKYRLPTIFPDRAYVVAGGLISYGPDRIDQYRRGAGYVDRILKGAKPADLPVQNPTKYELVINLKTAKALGIDIPATVLARADEVIE